MLNTALGQAVKRAMAMECVQNLQEVTELVKMLELNEQETSSRSLR